MAGTAHAGGERHDFVLTLTLTHVGPLPGRPPFLPFCVHFLKYILSSQPGSDAVLSGERQWGTSPGPSPRTERGSPGAVPGARRWPAWAGVRLPPLIVG